MTGQFLEIDLPLALILVLPAGVNVTFCLVVPSLYSAALVTAATAWSVAFLIYLWRFAPWLMSSRLDGKDG